MKPKFRAWISEADTMVNDLKGIDFENETVVLKKFYWEDGFPVEEEVFEVEIGNAILMQSTGLKDNNGKEIFEGDILDYKGRKALVRWHGSYASFIYRFVDELQKRNAEWNPLYLAYMRCEIIGNIYENPELWEVNG